MGSAQYTEHWNTSVRDQSWSYRRPGIFRLVASIHVDSRSWEAARGGCARLSCHGHTKLNKVCFFTMPMLTRAMRRRCATLCTHNVLHGDPCSCRLCKVIGPRVAVLLQKCRRGTMVSCTSKGLKTPCDKMAHALNGFGLGCITQNTALLAVTSCQGAMGIGTGCASESSRRRRMLLGLIVRAGAANQDVRVVVIH